EIAPGNPARHPRVASPKVAHRRLDDGAVGVATQLAFLLELLPAQGVVELWLDHGGHPANPPARNPQLGRPTRQRPALQRSKSSRPSAAKVTNIRVGADQMDNSKPVDHP